MERELFLELRRLVSERVFTRSCTSIRLGAAMWWSEPEALFPSHSSIVLGGLNSAYCADMWILVPSQGKAQGKEGNEPGDAGLPLPAATPTESIYQTVASGHSCLRPLLRPATGRICKCKYSHIRVFFLVSFVTRLLKLAKINVSCKIKLPDLSLPLSCFRWECKETLMYCKAIALTMCTDTVHKPSQHPELL